MEAEGVSLMPLVIIYHLLLMMAIVMCYQCAHTAPTAAVDKPARIQCSATTTTATTFYFNCRR